tara:strand:+ start:992 stop:2935 length:1944 start_codon:yes stop_codon:yes gene_type:complete
MDNQLKKLYLVEIDSTVRDNNQIKMPYSTGLIWSYCLQNKTITDNYELSDWICYRDNIDNVFEKFDNPDIVGFSSFVWNWEYNKILAKRIKEKYPNCLIVFGGKEPPEKTWLMNNPEWYKTHDYIDIIVHGEGELTFEEILLEGLKDKPDYLGVAGCSLITNRGHLTTLARQRINDLDEMPSPYLNGLFEELYEKYKDDYIFSAVIESCRGCPYSCTFCEIGDKYFTKVKKQPLDKLFKEIEWIGSHGIDYIDDANSNFGLYYDRDIEIANWLVECNEKYDNPKKYKVDWAKNKAEKLFDIAKILHDGGIHKGMTLALQSMNEPVLKAIKRKNLVSRGDMNRITKMYEDAGISTYVEIIMGLPDESLDSFKEGVCEVLEFGEHNYIGLYVLSGLRNTPFGDPNYIKQYGLKSKKVLFPAAHFDFTKQEVIETSDLVIGNSKLEVEEWKDMFMFAWLILSCHYLGFTQYTARFLREHLKISYLEFYDKLFSFFKSSNSIMNLEYNRTYECINKIVTEKTPKTFWGRELKETGDFRWEFEEASGIKFIKNIENFYKDLTSFLESNFNIEDNLLKSLLSFQEIGIVNPVKSYPTKQKIDYNFLDVIYNGDSLKNGGYEMVLNNKNYNGDLFQYAKEVLWWRRKDSLWRTI